MQPIMHLNLTSKRNSPINTILEFGSKHSFITNSLAIDAIALEFLKKIFLSCLFERVIITIKPFTHLKSCKLGALLLIPIYAHETLN